MSGIKYVPIELDCGCTKWFPSTSRPDIDEPVWCARHETEELPGPAEARREGRVIDAENEFWSEIRTRANKRRYYGGCLYEGCKTQESADNWFRLRDKMHAHYMRTHTRFGASIQFEKVSRDTQSVPPF